MKSVLIMGTKSEMAKTTAEFYTKNGWDLSLAVRNVNVELLSFRNQLKDDYGCEIYLHELYILDFQSHIKFFNSFQKNQMVLFVLLGY